MFRTPPSNPGTAFETADNPENAAENTYKIQHAQGNYNAFQALEEQSGLSVSLKDTYQSIKKLTAIKCTKPEPESFADMVKKSPNNYVKPANVTPLAIFPRNKQQKNEVTKDQVQKYIRPETMQLHIRGIRKTKNGGVIISTESKNDIEKLKKLDFLTSSDLTDEEPQKR